MACGSCAGKRAARAGMEFLAIPRNGGEQKRFATIAEANTYLGLNGGGTYKAVAKTSQ